MYRELLNAYKTLLNTRNKMTTLKSNNMYSSNYYLKIREKENVFTKRGDFLEINIEQGPKARLD